MSERRKVVASLNQEQFTDLTVLMSEDGQTNFTFYIVYLIQQEKKRRSEEKTRRSPGRPKKEDDTEVLYYPSPDKHVSFPYTEIELKGYYDMRKETMPALPTPLTKEELKKFDL